MANQEHLDLLKQGTDVWNAWRKQYSKMETKLDSDDISANEFGYIPATAHNIPDDLKRYYTLGRFGTDGLSSIIGRSKYIADLSDADLSSLDLSDADLSAVNLRGAALDRADLSYANLSRAELSEAGFRKAFLPGANLAGAHLLKADLTLTDLRATDFSLADLSESWILDTDFRKAILKGANLENAVIERTWLSGANLSGANLSGANLNGANLSRANLIKTNLRRTRLKSANLSFANLTLVDLSKAILTKTSLVGATLIGTNLTNATLKDCEIYGISAWDVELQGATQFNLVITPGSEPTITVDNLKVAQFIYLLLNNKEIRDVIDTLAKKAVLILGRFSEKRKPVLEALREALRKKNYLPILFDFENPKSRDVTETVRTLAHLSRFILADLTDPSSIPLELDTIVPYLEVPIQPLLLETNREFSMFSSLRKYHWVLPIQRYADIPSLLVSIENLLTCAEKKVDELAIEKARRLLSNN